MPDGETHLTGWMSKSGEMVDGKGTYQIKKLRKALEYCTNYRTAADVGAHVGLWSMQLMKRFAQVHAFEPVPLHYHCLLQNLTDNDFDDPGGKHSVRTHQFALGEKEQRVRIRTAPTSTGDSWVDSVGHMHDIKMRTLDSFDLQDVDFIKIDCEGYEKFVLMGGEETIKRCRPCIIVEQKPGHAQRFGLGERDAVAYLLSLGAVMRAEMSGDFILSFP